MKPIKNTTFDAIDNLASELEKKSKTDFEKIRLKIMDYLMKNSNKDFVLMYNTFVKDNNHTVLMSKLKID